MEQGVSWEVSEGSDPSSPAQSIYGAAVSEEARPGTQVYRGTEGSGRGRLLLLQQE